MAARVDFLQVKESHVSVNRGRVQPRVAKQLLDDPNVSAPLQHVSGT